MYPLALLAPIALLSSPADTARRDSVPSCPPREFAVAGLARLGSEAEERDRARQVRGERPTAGQLLRSASTRTDPLCRRPGELAWAVVLPDVQWADNRNLPLSLNDGALWSGVGANLALTTGVRLEEGRVRIVLAPTFTWSANRPYAVANTPPLAPAIEASRSPFSSPYHYFPRSLDTPLRFGDAAYRTADLGESSITIDLAPTPVAVGVATERQWWGPGARNALLLSGHAAGFPHAFVRTSRPLATPIGGVEVRYLLGALQRSSFFVQTDTGGMRSIAGLAATLDVRGVSGLTVGAARLVTARVDGFDGVVGGVFNPLRNTGRPNAVNIGTRWPADNDQDQLLSLFGRWVAPEAGVELWAEWGRAEMPRSVGDFLEAPGHSQAFTFGLQHVRPWGTERRWRLLLEHTQTNQSATFQQRPTGSWYASRAVGEGFTQRGQILGAAVGPGAHAQVLSFDLQSRGWSAGVFAHRIRWDDDAFYTIPKPIGNGLCMHDVSLLGGAQVARLGSRWHQIVRATWGNRLNAFWQSREFCPTNTEGRTDVRSFHLQLTLSPAMPR